MHYNICNIFICFPLALRFFAKSHTFKNAEEMLNICSSCSASDLRKTNIPLSSEPRLIGTTQQVAIPYYSYYSSNVSLSLRHI